MVHMGIPEGGEWFFGDSAMAIDRAATGRQQWTNSRAMERRRDDENGREAIGEEKGECRLWIWKRSEG